MAVEVTLDSGTVRPIGGIGLPSLNNVLINVCLSKKKYEAAKNAGGGRELTPTQCSSMRQAAYTFKPEVTVTAATKELPIRRNSRVVADSQGGGERAGGSVATEQVDPEELLPGATEEQEVPYWLNCSNESDLVAHFRPNAVVDVMRPANKAIDRLGLLKRLRVVSATLASAQSELQAGRLKELTQEQAAPALAVERERLQGLLRDVRTKILRQVDSDDRVALSDRDLLTRAQGDSGAYSVFDKKEIRSRLEAVLNAAQAAEGGSDE